MTDYYQWQGSDLLLSCHLQPKAARDEFVGRHGEALKIRIAAPPIEGRANAQLIKFLAKQFGVSRRQVDIVSGESGRRKRVRIHQPVRIPVELDIASAR